MLSLEDFQTIQTEFLSSASQRTTKLNILHQDITASQRSSTISQSRTLAAETLLFEFDQRVANGQPPIGSLGERPFPGFNEAWWLQIQNRIPEAIDKCIEINQRWNNDFKTPLITQLAEKAALSPENASQFLERFACSKPEPVQTAVTHQNVFMAGVFENQKLLVFEDPETHKRQGYYKQDSKWMPFDGFCIGLHPETHIPYPQIATGTHSLDPLNWMATSYAISQMEDLISFKTIENTAVVNQTLSYNDPNHPSVKHQETIESYFQILPEIEHHIESISTFLQNELGNIGLEPLLPETKAVLELDKLLTPFGIQLQPDKNPRLHDLIQSSAPPAPPAPSPKPHLEVDSYTY